MELDICASNFSIHIYYYYYFFLLLVGVAVECAFVVVLFIRVFILATIFLHFIFFQLQM